MVFKKREKTPDILNMPNTRNVLSSNFLESLIWFNIEPVSDHPKHMSVSLKILLKYEDKEKTPHYVDYAHSIEILYTNLLLMLEVSCEKTTEYNIIYSKGLANLKAWFIENKHKPKNEMSTLGFNRESNL